MLAESHFFPRAVLLRPKLFEPQSSSLTSHTRVRAQRFLDLPAKFHALFDMPRRPVGTIVWPRKPSQDRNGSWQNEGPVATSCEVDRLLHLDGVPCEAPSRR